MTNPWFPRPAPGVAPRVRVFGLPHAGAGASLYAGWSRALSSDGIDFVPVQLPGRESRLSEPAIASLPTLAAAVADAMEPLLDRPFALFGHSMGALLAFEIGRTLAAGGAVPSHLFLSGALPPTAPRVAPPLHALGDAELLGAVAARYGGVPRQVLDSAELRTLITPALRADLAVVETYAYQPGPALGCPMSVFGGRRDPIVPPVAMAGWRAMTRGAFSCHYFDGDHFFIRQAASELRSHIAAVFRHVGDTCVPGHESVCVARPRSDSTAIGGVRQIDRRIDD